MRFKKILHILRDFRNFGGPRGLLSRCKTYRRQTVTAEVASSSLVVRAILSQGLIGRDTESSYPQSNPQSLLYTPGFESHGFEKLLLSRNHLVEVFVRVQIESRLAPRMSQDSR
jgi:hypothetical protein